MKFVNKVVIVTGASSGIGEATAKFFAKKGAKVVLAACSKEKLEKLVKELPHAFVVPTDMTKQSNIERLARLTKEKFGKVDILINNAGRGYDAAVEAITVGAFHDVFDLDLLGPILAMQQVIPLMREQKRGVIVNISSGTALMVLPHMSVYASLKQALAKISLTAREELKKDNINVTVVYPYITDTNFEKNTLREGKEPEWSGEVSGRKLPPADSPEFVAEKILHGIQHNDAEVYAHDWMKTR